MYQIETFQQVENFKKIKPEKKIKKNIKYGTSGNTGKNYSTRSFGGGMSNRKYTKKQVKPHKLLPNNQRTGEISNIKPNRKQLVPPLYPTTLGSLGENNRSGYINPHNTTIIPDPNNINKYIYPSQELINVNMESEPDNKKNNYKIIIKNKNIIPDNNNNTNGNIWNDYDGTYNGGYYGPNTWFTYNPYLYGPSPYSDENKNIIINNYTKENEVEEDMKVLENNENIWDKYKTQIIFGVAIIIILKLLAII